MMPRTLLRLAPLCLVACVAACGGSPETPVGGSVPPSVAATPSATPAGTQPVRSDAPGSAPSEAVGSDAASPAAGIPESLRGRWLSVAEGGTAEPCTEELEAEGRVMEVDATRISSFAWLADLTSVEESDENSLRGTFSYADDSDGLITERFGLQVVDDGQSLTLTDLDDDTDTAPTNYARCLPG